MISNCIKSLKNSGVVIFPTETVYALACSAYSGTAIEHIYALKKRPKNKPFSIFLTHKEQIPKFAIITKSSKNIIHDHIPGPTTIVLPIKSSALSKQYFNDTIGIRIPTHPIACDILEQIDFPLVATSVNISGSPSINRYEDINIDVDYIIKDNDGITGKSSQIIDCAGDSPIVLRN